MESIVMTSASIHSFLHSRKSEIYQIGGCLFQSDIFLTFDDEGMNEKIDRCLLNQHV